MDESRLPDDTPTWEQSKENVLPLKSGRKLNELSAALSGGGTAECKLREQQEAFELELRMYAGDDPLEPWCRYVSWVEQNYPRGGREANLKSLLEKCISTFLSDARYTNEKRFLDLCIKLANIYPEPNDVFTYLHSHSVGCQLAGFFIAWSWVLENSGHLKMADAVLQEGFARGAQPIDKLQKCIHDFQARVVLSIANSGDDVATELDGADLGLSAGMMSLAGSQQQRRATLAELRVNRQGKVGHDRVSGAISAGPLTLGSIGTLSAPARQQLGGKPWKMFTDDDPSHGSSSSGATLPPQNKEWVTMPESAPKENTFNPAVWTKAKVPQKLPSSGSTVATVRGHASSSVGSTAVADSAQFTVHCDQEEPVAAPPRPSSIKTTTGSSIEGAAVIGYRPVLSARKAEVPSNAADRLNSLRDSSGGGAASETTEVVMYDRHKLYMGVTEVSFEELRAGAWLKQYRTKMEWKKQLEEQSRALEARLRAEQEADLERLRLVQSELERKQRALEERERDLERRQHELAAAAATGQPKADQQSEQQQKPKRPRLHVDCAQPGLQLDHASTKSQPTFAIAVDRSTGEDDPSRAAASNLPARMPAPLSLAVNGHVVTKAGTADEAVGELLSTSVGHLNLADRPAASRAPLGVLSVAATPASLPVKDTVPTAAAASSPAEGETRHVLGWYCGSFNTSAARSAPADQYNTSACSEQASVQPSPDHLPRFYVHLDESSVATGSCNQAPQSGDAHRKLLVYEDPVERNQVPQSGDVHRKLLVYEDPVERNQAPQSGDAHRKLLVYEDPVERNQVPQSGDVHRKLLVYEDPVESTAAPTGSSHRSVSSSSSAVSRFVGLDITGQDVTDRQSNCTAKEDRATLADQQRAAQPAAGGRLQIFEDEPIVDRASAGQQLLRDTAVAACGGVSRQRQPLDARLAAAIPGPIALDSVRDAVPRGQSAPEKDCRALAVNSRPPESVAARAGVASATTACAAAASVPAALVSQQQQHSAFRPFGGSCPMDQESAAASISNIAAAPWELRAADGFDKENRARCKGNEPKGTAVPKSSLDEEATARREPPRLGGAEPPRAAPAGARAGLRPPTEEEPMDGIEIMQNDFTEQLLGVSAVAAFAGRQASTPCSYRSSAADGLLAACCPDDLTTIHPVLLGSGALRLAALDEDCGLEERYTVGAAGAPGRAGSAAGEPRGRWQPEPAAEPPRPGLRAQAPLSLASAAGQPSSDFAVASAPVTAEAGAHRTALSSSVQAAQTANDTAPTTFVRPATLRLSPIAECSDSSKASSSTASSAQSGSGHHSTTVGSSMSSQALSRLASMTSAATTPHHAATRDASSLQTSASSSSLQQSQRSLPQLLQGQLQQQPQQQTIEPAKPASHAQLPLQPTMTIEALTMKARGSGSDMKCPTPIEDPPSRDRARAAECDRASPLFEEPSAGSQVRDAAPSSCTDDGDELVLPPGDLDGSDDLLFDRLRGCGGMNATSHEIDTTHYSPVAFLDATQTEKLLNTSIAAVRNPFDSKILSKLLGRLRPPLSTYKGYCRLLADLPATIKVHQKLNLGDGSYTIVRKVGEGGFASVYVASCNFVDHSKDFDASAFEQASVTGSSANLCLKVQRPAGGGEWEFYMCSEVSRRLSRNLELGSVMTDVRASIMDVPRAYFLANGSVLVNEYVPDGSLLNLVNQQLAAKCRLPEAVVMYLAIELFSIVEQLHACGVIHGDIKPDNLLLRGLFPLTPNNSTLCPTTRSLLLIDFGRSIDMTKFPEGTTFSASNDTSGFQCIEMKTDRPWTYQTDLFGLVGTIHVLLFGEYMKVYCAGKQWKINSKYQRFWQVDLWRRIFETLLNVPDCDSIPPLAPFRQDLEQCLRSSKLSKEYQDFVESYNSAACRRN